MHLRKRLDEERVCDPVRVGWVSRHSRRNPPEFGGWRLASSADPPYKWGRTRDLWVMRSAERGNEDGASRAGGRSARSLNICRLFRSSRFSVRADQPPWIS